MFNNIGSKLKGVARVATIIGMVGSVISGLAMFDYSALAGFIVIALGCLFAWLGSLALYGFGELVENSAIIAEEVVKQSAPAIPSVQQSAYRPPVSQYRPPVSARPVCQQCGRTQEPGTKFCSSCGTQII